MESEIQRRILSTLEALDAKVDGMRDEMLLNRDDMNFVKEIRKLTTVEQYKTRIEKFDYLLSLRNKVIGGIVVGQFLVGVILWYINKIWS